MPWTHKDFAQMHFHYGLCDGDAQGAAETFRNQYTFSRKYGSNPKPIDEDLIFPTARDILRIHKMYERGEVPDENTITGGRIEGERILFSNSGILRPQITKDYMKERLRLCKTLTKKFKDKNFFDRVLWTGVAVVGSDYFETNNYERQYETDHDDGQYFEITVWVGMLGGEVIGPHEMPKKFTDKVYTKFLKDDLWNLLEDIPLSVRKKMWIQVEDADYVGKSVKKFLNDNYEGKWMGPKGPINWPPLTHDLHPVKYLWGIVTVAVYVNKCDSKEEILERINKGIQDFKDHQRREKCDKLTGTFKEIAIRRFEVCVQENGADITFAYAAQAF